MTPRPPARRPDSGPSGGGTVHTRYSCTVGGGPQMTEVLVHSEEEVLR